MNRVSRLAALTWSIVALGGCAAITGLDQIQETECAPNCDGGPTTTVDGTIDSPPQGDDSPAGPDGTSESSDDSSEPQEASSDDSSGGGDGPSEAGSHDAGADSHADAPADAPADVHVDAPVDSGCGPLNTTSNCSACGDKCASGSSELSASCAGPSSGVGAVCSYVCQSGYLDCDHAVNPPNLNGCECHAPSGATQANCGGNGCCPVAHNNGLGQATSNFFDCVLTGTYNSTLAHDACVSFVGQANASQCTQGQCVGADGGPSGDLVWCSSGSTTDCSCWTYSGTDVGHVHDEGAAGTSNCFCADKTLDPSYN